MKDRTPALIAVVASALFATTVSLAAMPAATTRLDGAQYLPQAKVTLAQARKIALHTAAGKIVAEELERESGGSGLRYSFDIALGKQTHEIGVDAMTGKLLENSIEGDNAD